MNKTTEPKHTPGPWLVSGTSITTADDKYCIATIEDDGGYQAPSEQREANARLIAAAPKLLKALEHAMVCDYPEEIDFRCADCVKARTLINKVIQSPVLSSPDEFLD